MPGQQVPEPGAVFVQGQFLETFFLAGDDLFPKSGVSDDQGQGFGDLFPVFFDKPDPGAAQVLGDCPGQIGNHRQTEKHAFHQGDAEAFVLAQAKVGLGLT